MNFDRTDRISEEVRREIDRIIREEVRDPRVGGTWSITHADVTRDLRYAKVRVSVLEEDRRKPMLAALKSASGFIRRELGRQLRLRYTPELLFEEDDNIAYGVRIASILEQARKGESRDDAPGGEEET